MQFVSSWAAWTLHGVPMTNSNQNMILKKIFSGFGVLSIWKNMLWRRGLAVKEEHGTAGQFHYDMIRSGERQSFLNFCVRDTVILQKRGGSACYYGVGNPSCMPSAVLPTQQALWSLRPTEMTDTLARRGQAGLCSWTVVRNLSF